MKSTPAFIVRRIPLAALYRNTLVLCLACSRCGHSFTVDYRNGSFRGREGKCPKCAAKQHLRPVDLRRTLEKSFRAGVERAEMRTDQFWREIIGVTIANAARLLEPILLVVVVHFWHQVMGHYIQTTITILRRLKKAGFGEALLFAMPPNPATASNRYLEQKWGERFIITVAAISAFHLLEKKPTILDALRTRLQNWRANRHAHDIVQRELDHAATFDFNRFEQAIDLLPSVRYKWLLSADLWDIDNTPPFVFSKKDDERASQWFSEHAISRERPFACFLGRDFAYSTERKTHANPFSWQRYRNIDIQTYLPSMRWLVEQGITPFRMGSVAKERLATDDARIVDYPFKGRNEFMDIYLTGKCLFFVSCLSGLDILSAYMGKWLLLCNTPYMSLPSCRYLSNICHIPKKMWCHTRRRYLSFREVIKERRNLFFANPKSSVVNGASLVDNTPEEIAAGVREVYARATGVWDTGKEEEAMQAKYRRILAEAYPGLETNNIFSYNYFKMNPWLLD